MAAALRTLNLCSGQKEEEGEHYPQLSTFNKHTEVFPLPLPPLLPPANFYTHLGTCWEFFSLTVLACKREEGELLIQPANRMLRTLQQKGLELMHLCMPSTQPGLTHLYKPNKDLLNYTPLQLTLFIAF